MHSSPFPKLPRWSLNRDCPSHPVTPIFSKMSSSKLHLLLFSISHLLKIYLTASLNLCSSWSLKYDILCWWNSNQTYVIYPMPMYSFHIVFQDTEKKIPQNPPWILLWSPGWLLEVSSNTIVTQEESPRMPPHSSTSLYWLGFLLHLLIFSEVPPSKERAHVMRSPYSLLSHIAKMQFLGALTFDHFPWWKGFCLDPGGITEMRRKPRLSQPTHYWLSTLTEWGWVIS